MIKSPREQQKIVSCPTTFFPLASDNFRPMCKKSFIGKVSQFERLHFSHLSRSCSLIASISGQHTKTSLVASTTERNSRAEFTRMETSECPGCRKNDEKDSCQKKPHIHDLCPADRDKIAQLVKKLAESTQARHEAEAELAEIRSEHESLINRCDLQCNEHENERSILKQQLAVAASRDNALKLESTRSLNALGDQLDAQEKEFAKLTETVRDLLREKIQLQNALIERESKVRIAESKLERAKESLEMEKLLFIKEHARDSILRKNRDRGTQTHDDETSEHAKLKDQPIVTERRVSTKIKSKDDLEDPSGDGLLLRSLFFAAASPYEDEQLSRLDILNSPIK